MGEIIGRLSRRMPIEHLTCDEYVPLPGGKYYFNYRPAAIKEKVDNRAYNEEYGKAHDKALEVRKVRCWQV